MKTGFIKITEKRLIRINSHHFNKKIEYTLLVYSPVNINQKSRLTKVTIKLLDVTLGHYFTNIKTFVHDWKHRKYNLITTPRMNSIIKKAIREEKINHILK